MAEVTDWRSEMQRIEQKRPNNVKDVANDELK